MTTKLSVLNLRFYIMVLMAHLIGTGLHAQSYCSPSFVNGCSLWNSKSIAVGGINWSLGGSNCQTWDYTTDTAFFNAGTIYPMYVTTGDWCGCGVWIDFNNDQTFDTTENLYHMYIASQTAQHTFSISIPGNVVTGTYRMRVIAGWGTDTYTVSANGYGPCGSYQYGNYNDFSAHVTGSASVANINASALPIFSAQFTAAGEDLIVITKNVDYGNTTLQVYDANGRLMTSKMVTNETEKVNVSLYAYGLYLLRLTSGGHTNTIKVIK